MRLFAIVIFIMNDTDNTPNQIQDAELIEDNDSSTEASQLSQSEDTEGGLSQAGMILELETMIKNHISGISTRRNELKKFKEMVVDAFKNDSTYQEVEEAYKKATKVKKDIKANIMQQPGVQEAAEKVRDISTEIKELEGALSDYAREYQRLSGSNEIEDNEGNVHEIVYIAKLLKKNQKQK